MHPLPAGPVADLAGLQRVLRSNGWPSDILSTSPWEAISARGDLSPDADDRSADGAYDAKVSERDCENALVGAGGLVDGLRQEGIMSVCAWKDLPGRRYGAGFKGRHK
jgi:hypothetical protein